MPNFVENVISALNKQAQSTASKAASSAVTEVENNPDVQAALANAQAQAALLKKIAYVVGAAAALVFIFYYLPRFENPIKQMPFIKRGKKRK